MDDETHAWTGQEICAIEKGVNGKCEGVHGKKARTLYKYIRLNLNAEGEWAQGVISVIPSLATTNVGEQ